MVRCFLVVLILLIASCGSVSKRAAEQTSGQQNRPLWVNDPLEYCQEEFLCAVGEGSSFYLAESDARKNLAKTFKVRVSGTTEINEESSSLSSADSMESLGVTQDIYSQNFEVVDEVLEGVVTSKKHEEDGSIFSLAQLDKRVAGKIIKNKIAELDSEIEQAYTSQRRSLLPKAFELYSTKSGLVTYLTILGMPNFSRGVTKEQLLERKTQFDNDPKFVVIEADEKFDFAKETVSSELMTLGYKVKKSGPYDFKLMIKSNARREYLNVKGFERYMMSVKISSLSSAGEIVGNLAFEQSQNGRSLAQIKSLIEMNFRQYFSENFQALELD